LGRAILQQTQQGPNSSTYDSVASAYDSRGRAASQTLPYTAALGSAGYSPVPAEPGLTTTYDALNRTALVADGGSGTTQYTYSGNDVLVAIGPAPSGEYLKKRNLEYNGAGWLTSVCEVITSTKPAGGSCGQTSSYTGYLTKYTYDGGRLITVQQNAQPGSTGVQTRSMTYDGLGRKLSQTIPEWSAGSGVAGTSTYTYDSDSSGTCTGTYTGKLVKRMDNAGNVTCFTYDLLHRRLSRKVVSGPYSSVTPTVYDVYDAATLNGTAMQNVMGSVAEAYTCTGSCTSKLTDVFDSSTPVTSGTAAGGVLSQLWESTPNSGGYFLTQTTSYPNGSLAALSASKSGASIGVPNMTYGIDGEGRLSTATDTTYSLNLVAATVYNAASSPTSLTYGNASTGSANDVDDFTYDPNTYRPTNLTYNVSPSSGTYAVSSALTWNANSSLQQMAYTDGSDSTKNQTCTYSADDLSRIASVNCSSAWAQNFTYDAFGNIQKSGSSNYIAAYSTVTNQVSGGPSYDANGNQLTSTPASLTWNALNQPITVNSTTATYDALGRMVEKGSGGTYTQFVYSPGGHIIAMVQAGSLVKGTIPLPGGGTAIYNGSGLNYIRHKDWLGSSRLATTWGHAIYSKEAYAPFGETYNEAGTPDRSFTGQDQDVVTGSGGTGVYDYLFRKYDPSAGRWLSPDPSGWKAVTQAYPQSLNRYAYVQNNPMSLTDPDGHSSCALPDGNGGVTIDYDPADMGQFCTYQGGVYTNGDLEYSDLQDLKNGNLSFYIMDDAEDGGPDRFYDAVQAGIDNRPLGVGGGKGQISEYDSDLLAEMRDTLWGGDQSGDYLGNQATGQWLANGNITPYDPSKAQDGVCSLSNALGDWMNNNDGMVSACGAHDSGYENDHCNKSSWLGFFLPGACTMDNLALVITLAPEFVYYGAKWALKKVF
jgi:RHS repeat-associated protein